MTSRDFAFWLQGYLEIENQRQLDQTKIDKIRSHLNLVFVHEIDPSMGDEEEQKKLDYFHNPPNGGSGIPQKNNDFKMRC